MFGMPQKNHHATEKVPKIHFSESCLQYIGKLSFFIRAYPKWSQKVSSKGNLKLIL